MPVIEKNKRINKAKKTTAIVDQNVGDYEKHPFFVKKANDAKALIKKAGLPKKLAKTK